MNASGNDLSRVLIIAPVYNDWLSFAMLLRAIDAHIPTLHARVDVIAVDDGSTTPMPQLSDLPMLEQIGSVSVLHLVCNLGNQRAIAVGLAHVSKNSSCDLVIILDSDGEDRPEELVTLIRAHRENPDRVVVGQRVRRAEGLKFRLLYGLYKLIFRAMIGQKIDFGNFCLVPGRHVARLAHMSELWNHLPATILRSKLAVERVETERGKRYAGGSSMTIISLIIHGLSAMAAFSDVLFVRLLATSCVIIALGAAVAGVATALRAFTELAIPGWATTAVGIALILILQGLVLSATTTFTTLNNRTNRMFVPAEDGPRFVSHVSRIKD
jgi:glycosyltransferase involved in cell wall biosynthesis